MPNDPRPLGSTALAVATSLLKPVVVVPPDATPPEALRRVLVPLEGPSRRRSPRVRSSRSRAEPTSRCSCFTFTMRRRSRASPISRSTKARRGNQEFLARYCPWGVGLVGLETRVGSAAAVVPAVAEETGCDLIALGWSQDLAAGRAGVVRAALERARVPVLLVPVLAILDQLLEGVRAFRDRLGRSRGSRSSARRARGAVVQLGVRSRVANVIAAAYQRAGPVALRVHPSGRCGRRRQRGRACAGNDLLRLFLVRRRVPTACSTLAATLAVGAIFDVVVGTALIAWALAIGALPGFDALGRLPSVDWFWVFRTPWLSAAWLASPSLQAFCSIWSGRSRQALWGSART